MMSRPWGRDRFSGLSETLNTQMTGKITVSSTNRHRACSAACLRSPVRPRVLRITNRRWRADAAWSRELVTVVIARSLQAVRLGRPGQAIGDERDHEQDEEHDHRERGTHAV